MEWIINHLLIWIFVIFEFKFVTNTFNLIENIFTMIKKSR